MLKSESRLVSHSPDLMTHYKQICLEQVPKPPRLSHLITRSTKDLQKSRLHRPWPTTYCHHATFPPGDGTRLYTPAGGRTGYLEDLFSSMW